MGKFFYRISGLNDNLYKIEKVIDWLTCWCRPSETFIEMQQKAVAPTQGICKMGV